MRVWARQLGRHPRYWRGRPRACPHPPASIEWPGLLSWACGAGIQSPDWVLGGEPALGRGACPSGQPELPHKALGGVHGLPVQTQTWVYYSFSPGLRCVSPLKSLKSSSLYHEQMQGGRSREDHPDGRDHRPRGGAPDTTEKDKASIQDKERTRLTDSTKRKTTNKHNNI